MIERPELGKIKAGDAVFIRRSPDDQRGRPESERYIPARIEKAARVWIDIVSAEGIPLRWRMRRDTQAEQTSFSGSRASFLTAEQHVWEIEEAAARAYLNEQGLTIERGSPWRGREGELAELLRKAGS